MSVMTKRIQAILVAAAFVASGCTSTTLLGAQAKAPGTGKSDKDAKMSVVTVRTLDTNETKRSDDKDSKASLTCGKLVAALQAIWEENGSEAFNERMVQLFREMSLKQAKELLVPVSRTFLSKMSDEAIIKIMVSGGVLSVCLDCFQERLTKAIIGRVVSLVISLCPTGAVDMIKILATDQRTKWMITADAINKPFKTGSSVRSDTVDFATRLKILQLLCSLDVTRNKVLPASVAKAESDLQIVV